MTARRERRADGTRVRGRARGPATCTAGRARRQQVTLLEGDCFERLTELDPQSIDAVVTDPPYAIGWQNEEWDAGAIRRMAAEVAERKLGPGEAFEVWARLLGEGCLRVLKPGAYLLAFGSPRTFHRLACGLEDAGLEIRDTLMWLYGEGMVVSHRYPGGRRSTLKPAFEPIVVARRPLEGTTAETIERFGTGALNVEACRVGERLPANVILGHEPECADAGCAPGCTVAALDAQAAERLQGSKGPGPSRFFYSPKARRRERDAGCEHLPERALRLFSGVRKSGDARNPHPCLKPLELMRWLVRLSCPPGGLVLDPTCGSGTTGAAAVLEGRRFVGIEMDPLYVEISEARISHWAGLADRQVGDRRPLGRQRGRR